MITINKAKRLIKRVILTNLLSNDLYMTPLISGKHGIGKSAIMKDVAHDINADLIVIEGGTLKEGEITGLPYQYKDGEKIEFKFLPYYAIREVQEKEKTINLSNSLTTEEKLNLLKEEKIKPTIIFIDELNRTENAVYRELMNIILTKTVNGYKLPWWVFFTAAVNPSSIDSMYATNEMDPAQLDRFIKIKVCENLTEFLTYTLKNNFDESIANFLSNNGSYLSGEMNLEDFEDAMPSPRGWEMVNYILKSKDIIKPYFSDLELKSENDDIESLIICKLGTVVASSYLLSLKNPVKLITANDIFDYNDKTLPNNICDLISKQSMAMNSVTNKSIILYLIDNYDEDKLKYSEIMHKKIKKYMDLIDKSSKLVFAELLTNSITVKQTSLYDEFYDLFDDELIKTIYQNMKNEDVLANG